MKKKGATTHRFVRLTLGMMETKAWQSLDGNARAIYVELVMLYRGGNNGSLGLSARQWEVLGLLLKGLPNKLIARKLDISENTTKIHVSAVLRALGVSSRTQALLAANRVGLRLDA